jgi:uncharacterized protein (TIGR02453 family)
VTVNPAKPHLEGFSAGALSFLKELAETQNREWFQAHKSEYDCKLKQPLSAIVAALQPVLEARGINLNCDPERALFRIQRDVRFSKDKRPYKTNIGAALTRDGVKRSPGVLYIHIDPAGSFAAAGFHVPEPSQLFAIRRRIAESPDEFKAVVASLKSAGYDLLEEDALKRTPGGFESVKDPDVLRWLRLKSLVVKCTLSRKMIADGHALIAAVADFAAAAHPLLTFGWDALSSS